MKVWNTNGVVIDANFFTNDMFVDMKFKSSTECNWNSADFDNCVFFNVDFDLIYPTFFNNCTFIGCTITSDSLMMLIECVGTQGLKLTGRTNFTGLDIRYGQFDYIECVGDCKGHLTIKYTDVGTLISDNHFVGLNSCTINHVDLAKSKSPCTVNNVIYKGRRINSPPLEWGL